MNNSTNKNKHTVLVVDDDQDVRLSAHVLLSSHGFSVFEVDSPQQALGALKDSHFDLIILDMNFTTDTTSGAEGLRFLKQMKQLGLVTPVITMTAWANVDLAVEAMKNGAVDFIEKPWENMRLIQVVKAQLALKKLERKHALFKETLATNSESCLVWSSAAMKHVVNQIEQLAPTDATLLLTGENGTGKTEIARLVHEKSLRNEENFVAVNMGAIPETLFESEMFGHKKGAFTDARDNRTGRFEMAHQGTLFLDEIANIPLSLQAKLLRVLESSEFEPVGSSVTQQSDVRIISATNADFVSLISDNQFRQDLYYRLNTVEINIPPLRERMEDIPDLVDHFVRIHCARYKKTAVKAHTVALEQLRQHDWPGNIRELSHVVERAVLMAKGPEVSQFEVSASPTSESSQTLPLMTLEAAEKELILQALNKTHGHAKKAADLLGISASAMSRRMDKFDVK